MACTYSMSRIKLHDRIMELSRQIEGEFDLNCEEAILKSTQGNFRGVINGMNFDHGLGIMTVQGVTQQESEFIFKFASRCPLIFIATLNSEVIINCDPNSSQMIAPKNGGILAAREGVDLSLVLSKDEHHKILIVDVIRMLFLRKINCDLDTLPPTLQDVFRDTQGESLFQYMSSLNPMLLDAVESIFQNDKIGLERRLTLEAKCLEFVTAMVRLYRVDHSVIRDRYIFKSADIQLINKSKEILMDQIDDPPTIQNLSREVGMSTNKLQRGFQLIFEQSIKQFVISVRMHRAKRMIEENELSIGEIASLVGYTNKGHFSELFKKEFGLLPKDFRTVSRA